MKTISKVFIFLISTIIYGQSPDWSVDSSNFQYSMTFTTTLNVNGTTLTNTNDKIGAFVNDESRGEANIVYNANADKYLAYLTVYGSSGETISFKIYDSQNNQVVTTTITQSFQINANIGGVFQSLSIANPPLSNNAEITSFSINGYVSQTVINENSITISLQGYIDLTTLTPVFTTLNNGSLYINNVKQTSGVSVVNFTSSVNYQVLSEDETIVKDYEISVILENSSSEVSISLSTENLSTNQQPVVVNLTADEAISGLEISDFIVQNALISKILTDDDINYSIELVSFSQGSISIQLPEEKVLGSNNKPNSISNKLDLVVDLSKPYIKSIKRKNPNSEQTSTSEVIFEIIFSENVLNVTANDFTSVANSSIASQKVNDTTYNFTISNYQNNVGKLFLELLNTNDIKDLAGNSLQFSKIDSYEK